MRRITKGREPSCLVDLRNTPGADWSSVYNQQKQEMRDAAFAEQGGICAYCQSRLSGTHAFDSKKPTAGGMKIEHWAARSSREGEERLFDWKNLLGVCPGTTAGRIVRTFETHCDAARKNVELHVHPANYPPDAGTLFHYTIRGEIRPASGIESALSTGAIEDIESLNLNSPRLRVNRAEALAKIRSHLKSSTDFGRTARKLLERYRRPGPRLEPFHQAILLYLEKKVRQSAGR